MPQPIKKSGPYQKPRSKTVKKRAKSTVPTDDRLPSQKNPKSRNAWRKRKHPEYGTSKLEEKFAKEFLDKLNVKYIYQFKMESIGRYLDFYLPEEHMAIEIDGDFYHSYGLTYEQMSPMQKKNKRVDEQKDHWAIINGIPLLRIWEHDINKHPSKVLKLLKDKLYYCKKQKEIEDEKKKRH